MGGVGGLLGTAGGAGGTGFSGPISADVVSPVSVGQATTAYGQVQTGLQQQQALLAALQQQNGLQNQSNVYNQMQGIASGQGPNPAQAQLAQATGANVANQNALMAGQRGASQNVGLMARQAAQQGAATQQQAAGQAATMQAQQRLNALQGMGNLATTQAGQQIGATTGYTQAAQNEQANLLNSIAGVNSANVGMQSNINNVNGQLANTQLQGQQAMLGGLMNSMGGASGMMSGITSMLAKGGKVPRKRLDEGGDVSSDNMPQQSEQESSGAPEPSDASAGQFGTPTQVAAAPAINASTPSFGSDAGAAALGKGMGGGSSGGSGGGGGGGVMSLLALLAEGGRVGYDDDGGMVQAQPDSSEYSGQSKFGNFLHSQKVSAGNAAKGDTPSFGNNYGAKALYEGMSGQRKPAAAPPQAAPQQTAGGPQDPGSQSSPDTNNMGDTSPGAEMGDDSQQFAAAKGGKVPALLSPGEVYLTPSKAKEVSKDGKDPIKHGKKIPGKPKYPGNDYRNDTVKATLEEGGLVIPNKVMQSPNAHWEALKFVRNHIKSKK